METVSGTPTPGNQFPVNQLDPNADPAPDTSEVTTDDITSGESTSQVDAAELEAQEDAARTGWVDKTEWERQGKDPARWRPASEYIEVRERIKSINHEELQKRDAKIAALEAKLNQREQREHEDRTKIERESLRMELRNARENHDWDKFDEITDKLFDLKVSTAAAPKQPEVDAHTQEVWRQFQSANPWVEKDKELAANFIMELRLVDASKVTSDPVMGMQIAKSRVMRLYPEKFRQNGSRRMPAMAETGGNPGGAANGKQWSDLKPYYRDLAEADIAKGKYTKDIYLRNCLDDTNPAEYFRR